MHILVTGASSGIGEAIAREWAMTGAVLTLVARRRELLEKLAADLVAAHGTRCHVIALDLSDPARAAGCVTEAEAALGPVDVLVNNAGVQVIAPTATTDLDAAEASLRTNLLTPLRLTHAVLPGMLARGHGCIVDVASLAALGPTPGMTWYNAAKGGLAAASEALRGELRRTGVHVVTVYPGPVDTQLARDGYAAYGNAAAVKLLPSGTPAVLARRIRRAVERRRSRVIYPWIYFLTRHFPNITRWMLDRFSPPPRPR